MAGVENIAAAQAGLNGSIQFIGVPEAVAGPHAVHIGVDNVANQMVPETTSVILPAEYAGPTENVATVENVVPDTTAITEGSTAAVKYFPPDVVNLVQANLYDPHRRGMLVSEDDVMRATILHVVHDRLLHLKPHGNEATPELHDARVDAAVLLTHEIAASRDPERRAASRAVLEQVRFTYPQPDVLEEGFMDAVAVAETRETRLGAAFPHVLGDLVDVAGMLEEHLPEGLAARTRVADRLKQAAERIPDDSQRATVMEKAAKIYPPQENSTKARTLEEKRIRNDEVVSLARQGVSSEEIARRVGWELNAKKVNEILRGQSVVDTDAVMGQLTETDRERITAFDDLRSARLAREGKVLATQDEKETLVAAVVGLAYTSDGESRLNSREIAAVLGTNANQVEKILRENNV